MLSFDHTQKLKTNVRMTLARLLNSYFRRWTVKPCEFRSALDHEDQFSFLLFVFESETMCIFVWLWNFSTNECHLDLRNKLWLKSMYALPFSDWHCAILAHILRRLSVGPTDIAWTDFFLSCAPAHSTKPIGGMGRGSVQSMGTCQLSLPGASQLGRGRVSWGGGLLLFS